MSLITETNSSVANVDIATFGTMGDVKTGLMTLTTDPVAGHVLTCVNGDGVGVWRNRTPQVYKLSEIQPIGTDGGTASAGAWFTRVLNTIVAPDSSVTLSNNEFTLQPGVYVMTGIAFANVNVGVFQTRLYNVTLDTVQATGSNQNVLGNSFILEPLTLSTATTFRVEQRVTTTVPTFGLGSASNFGGPEVYTQVLVTRYP